MNPPATIKAVDKKKAFSETIYITRPIFPDLQEYVKELKDIWESKWLSNNGQKHQQLEEELRRFLNVPCLSLFNNGTNALLVAIKSLGLSGEVITTPFTFPATPHCLTWNGIVPVFCDIDPVTMNIDPDKIESLITPKTSAILAVHVFGTPCNVVKIKKIADKHNLKVIYDAAHAFGTKINGVGIGNFGDISMFSFHPTKLFHSGEGGALVYKDISHKAKVDMLKNFGIREGEEILECGINGKMNELQAAMGLVVLKYVSGEQQKRRILYDAYVKNLRGVKGISVLDHLMDVESSYQYFVIKIEKDLFGKSRDEVCDLFKKYNIFTRKYFYPLCSEYPHYKNMESSDVRLLPVAHKVVNEVLSMPFYGELTVTDINKITSILKSFSK